MHALLSRPQAADLVTMIEDGLSQNRSAADTDGVVAGLAARGDTPTEAAVRAARAAAGR